MWKCLKRQFFQGQMYVHNVLCISYTIESSATIHGNSFLRPVCTAWICFFGIICTWSTQSIESAKSALYWKNDRAQYIFFKKCCVVGFIWTPIEWSERLSISKEIKKTIWNSVDLFRCHCVPLLFHTWKTSCVAIFCVSSLAILYCVSAHFKKGCVSNKCTVIYASSLQREFCCVALFDFSMLPLRCGARYSTTVVSVLESAFLAHSRDNSCKT